MLRQFVEIWSTYRISWRVFIILMVIEVGAIGVVFWTRYHPASPPESIQEHLQKVEQSLATIKTLQKDLESMKKDIVSIQEEKAKVDQQLIDARALQTVSQEQIQAIKHEINPPKTTKDTVIDIATGFAGGIASSVIAALLVMWFTGRT